jgi:prepilin-type N-terminal cleavage/methylation domain-containing protein
MVRHTGGFTLVELMIAICVLAVGLLALAATAILVTRMVARGHRAAVAATFAGQRLERLRAQGCRDRRPGSDRLVVGGSVVARASWRYVTVGDDTHRVHVVVTHLAPAGHWRSDSIETVISCRR